MSPTGGSGRGGGTAALIAGGGGRGGGVAALPAGGGGRGGNGRDGGVLAPLSGCPSAPCTETKADEDRPTAVIRCKSSISAPVSVKPADATTPTSNPGAGRAARTGHAAAAAAVAIGTWYPASSVDLGRFGPTAGSGRQKLTVPAVNSARL